MYLRKETALIRVRELILALSIFLTIFLPKMAFSAPVEIKILEKGKPCNVMDKSAMLRYRNAEGEWVTEFDVRKTNAPTTLNGRYRLRVDERKFHDLNKMTLMLDKQIGDSYQEIASSLMFFQKNLPALYMRFHPIAGWALEVGVHQEVLVK